MFRFRLNVECMCASNVHSWDFNNDSCFLEIILYPKYVEYLCFFRASIPMITLILIDIFINVVSP